MIIFLGELLMNLEHIMYVRTYGTLPYRMNCLWRYWAWRRCSQTPNWDRSVTLGKNVKKTAKFWKRQQKKHLSHKKIIKILSAVDPFGGFAAPWSIDCLIIVQAEQNRLESEMIALMMKPISVMQPDGNSFCRDVVMDSVNKVYM